MSAMHDNALNGLRKLAADHPAVLVMFSGGKDSLAVLDLCRRVFARVVAVHMYLVPGLAVVEERIAFARERWGVDFLFTPHWLLSRLLRLGVYCFPRQDIGEIGLHDVFRKARAETGIRLVAHGGKKSDGIFQRRMIGLIKDDEITRPIVDWKKWDVLGYLAAQQCPTPEKFDLDLSYQCLLWLHDEHPDDYRKVCDIFPFAEAVVKRREWFGVAG